MCTTAKRPDAVLRLCAQVLHMLTVLCVGEPTMAEPGVVQLQTSSAAWIPHAQLVPALLDAVRAYEDVAWTRARCV